MTDGPVELESQLILRLPPVPASILRDVLRNNPSTLKDRLKIKLEPDMRHGTLFFDHYVMQAKLVDLPCIIESHKTIENKHIYKTADICQMLLCSFEDEVDEKPKKKDLRLDKRYLFPHGITPPLKNVRKRRFRKTLKKKQYSDQPELEKEVRRLLRTDYEAVQITWEVIDEEEQNIDAGGAAKSLMQGSKTNEEPTAGSSNRLAVEHIFGEDLSDSELEDGGAEEEESRLSGDSEEESRSLDSRASFSQDTKDSGVTKKPTQYVTSFSGDMFSGDDSSVGSPPEPNARSGKAAGSGSSRRGSKPNYSSMGKADLKDRLEALKSQLTEISARCQIQEAELASVENLALRQRLESVVDKLNADQEEKKAEIALVQNLLARDN